MRRRRKATTDDRELRNLARAGRWAEVRALLEERLELDPEDDEARAELERLYKGQPLRATETALMRKKRQEREMRAELITELNHYRANPAGLDDWKPSQLAQRRKRVALIRSTIGSSLPTHQAEDTDRYLADLAARLAHHRGKYRWLRRVGIGLSLLAAAGALCFFAMEHQATKAEQNLRAALMQRDIARVENAIKSADSGINRSVNRQLSYLIEQAHIWLERRADEYRKLEQQIASLETGEGSIRALPLAKRVLIKRDLDCLPRGMDNLKPRWQRLEAREKSELDRQKAEVELRFKQALPPMPQLTDNPVEDEAILRQQLKPMEELARDCVAACELFGLPTRLATPVQERLSTLRQLLADISALRRTTAMLPNARDYATYRKLLEENAPKLYGPALRMMAIRDHLPDEDKLRDQMQDHGRQLPPGMLKAARKALLKGGPSFTPAFHANMKQVQLMEDVFTATSLQKPLYEISSPGQPFYIIEERPEVKKDFVRFTPSPLTPGYALGTPQSLTWENPEQVYLRSIDATALLQETGISRESFFMSGNLPQLLDRLLHPKATNCPALARAYLFNRLLEVMRAHEWPTMLGTAYAPTLRADARSFLKLAKDVPFPLEAGCWLRPTAETAQVEEAFRNWFHEHRHHHYAREIQRNFGALVQVHPSYVGFMDAAGKPVLYRGLRQNALLWYISESGLTTTPKDEEPESPTIFSPIFIVERD